MHPSPRHMRRTQFSQSSVGVHPMKLFFIVIIGFILFFGCFFYWIKSTGNITISKTQLYIDKGDVYASLPKKLGIDVSVFRFRLYVKYFGHDFPQLQVGKFEIPKTTTLNGFFTSILERPVHSDQTITILPGWNVYDIDAYLSNRGILKVGEFIDGVTDNFPQYQSEYQFLRSVSSIEGFLYPDTYRIREDAMSDSIVRILLSQFQKKIGESYIALGKDAYPTLILASIVEREERDHLMQAKVAGVLKKRYNENTPIGADATVCTGYGKTQKQCTPAFIGLVIRENHPYNTRNKRGYPPTPISSISLQTWNAAKNPESSAYYYYLHDGEGNIHFAKTLEEHNLNKQKYIQ